MTEVTTRPPTEIEIFLKKKLGSSGLKKRGFYLDRHKPIYLKHTVGLGGIYVHLDEEGYRLIIRDYEIDEVLEESWADAKEQEVDDQ